MRWPHSLFALILLTALDGSPVMVESRQVHLIRTHSAECGQGANAVIKVGNVTLCVKETPDEVRHKVEEANE